MKLQNILWVAILLIIPANVWAYGDSSTDTGMCKKLNFSDFMPVNGAEVAHNRLFHFLRPVLPFRIVLRLR